MGIVVSFIKALVGSMQVRPLYVSASCPGNVVVSGGYLVTNFYDLCLACAVSPRMRAEATLRIKRADEQDFQLSNSKTCLLVCVRWPQFRLEHNQYYVIIRTSYFYKAAYAQKAQKEVDFWPGLMQKALEEAISIAPQENDTPFTLSLKNRRLPSCLWAQCAASGMVLEVSVTGDPAFYVNPNADTIDMAGKTGLGAFASAVTAVVAAVANFISSEKENICEDVIFRAAKKAHAEVHRENATSIRNWPSGYGIAVAVYGSVYYDRSKFYSRPLDYKLCVLPVIFLNIVHFGNTDFDFKEFWMKVHFRCHQNSFYSDSSLFRQKNCNEMHSIWRYFKNDSCNSKKIQFFQQYFKDLRKELVKVGRSFDAVVEPKNILFFLDEIETIPGVIGTGIPCSSSGDSVFVFSLECCHPLVLDQVLQKARARFGGGVRVLGKTASPGETKGLLVSRHTESSMKEE